MAQITRRRSGELVRGVFMILDEYPEGLQAKELLQRLERRVPPTAFEASTYPNRPDTRRYEKIVRFSTINAVKAGWLTKSKGQWSLTDEGQAALRAHPDPEHFYREAIRLYRQWARGQKAATEEEPEDVETAATLEEAEEAAWSEIEQHLGSMNPYDFQQLVGGLLRGMGYYVSWIAPPGRDGEHGYRAACGSPRSRWATH